MSSVIDALNFEADQFNTSQRPALLEMIEQLKPYGITHFAYNKFVGKDRYIALCPHNHNFRQWFGHSFDHDMAESQLNAAHHGKKASLWYNCNGTITQDYLTSANTNHGITIFRKTDDSIYEGFNFASTNDRKNIVDFYINNMDLLNHFADYFVTRMGTVLDHTIPGKLVHLKKPAVILPSDPLSLLSDKPQRKNNISFKGISTTLTDKQYICFKLMLRGLTNKQIGDVLKISYRTVESHVKIVLEKLNLTSRLDLRLY